MIRGKRIYLRPLEEKDTDLILKWRNDPEIMEKMISSHPISREEHLRWFHGLQKKNDRLEFVIVTINEEQPIGTVSLKDIGLQHSKAELGKLIGERKYRRKGYATEAAKLLVEYGFKRLGLNRIYARVLEYNEANIQLDKKLGFRVERVLREDVYKNGRFVNVVLMGLLRKDYYSNA